MNNNEFKKGAESLMRIRLTEEKKTEMLSRLREYVDQRAPAATPIARGGIRAAWTKAIWFLKSPYGYALAGFALLFALGGVSYAAEGSLPGDLLYSVKVNVNEPLLEAALVTQDARARWEAEKLDRRLKEVEELAEQGRLDDRLVTEAEQQIDRHFERAEAKQKQEKPAKVEAEVEETIRQHKDILENIKKPDDAKHNEKIERIEKKLDEKSKREDSKGNSSGGKKRGEGR